MSLSAPWPLSDEELDREVKMVPDVVGGHDTLGEWHEPAWRIRTRPGIGGKRSGLHIKFGRRADVERAIAALKAAGFRTYRDLFERKQERDRVIREAVAW